MLIGNPDGTRVIVRDGEFRQVSAADDSAGTRIAILRSLPEKPIVKALAPKRILVVEDNLDSVHTLVLLLRDMGHQVEYAINGYAALDLANRMRPDVVFLDLGLPGMDGFDVCSRMKSDPNLKSIRVIALTAYAQDEYRVRSMAVGCEQHLLKPVSHQTLAEILK